jgi:hypothetical protein
MKVKEQPALMPFIVVVARLVEYSIPIAAETAEAAKDIAEKMVMDGHADDYAHECDIQEDDVKASDPSDAERTAYRFLNRENDEHTF